MEKGNGGIADMGNMEHTPVVKEVTKYHMGKVHGNAKRNEEMVMNYLKLLANGIVKKRLSPHEAHIIRERKKRLENCNRFWSMETYEAQNPCLRMSACHHSEVASIFFF